MKIIITSFLFSLLVTIGLSAAEQPKPENKQFTLIYQVLPNRNEDGKLVPITPEILKLAQHNLIERFMSFGSDATLKIRSLKANRLELNIANTNEKQAKEFSTVLSNPAMLSIHSAHPLHNENPAKAFELARKVAEGKEIVPSYRAYPDLKKDENNQLLKNAKGNYIVERYYLVKRRAELTSSDIDRAHPDPTRPDSVNISLDNEGADKMKNFTLDLKKGDLIVSILNGKVVSAAHLQAEFLGKHFQISGLTNIKESKDLALALNTPFNNEIKLLAIQPTQAIK